MSFNNIFIGIVFCIIFEIALVAILNLTQKEDRNRILGLICALLIITLSKTMLWEYIKDTFLYYIIGGPEKMLYAPLLYAYLLSYKDESLNVNWKSHLKIIFAIYIIVHPLRLIISDINHFDIVPVYLILVVILSVYYYYKGFSYYKMYIKPKLKSYPKWRFQTFYIIFNLYIALKICILVMAVTARLINTQSANEFSANVIIPTNNYVLIPVLILFCFMMIFYALTELSSFKKYFLNISVHEDESYIIKGHNALSIEDYLLESKIYLKPDLDVRSFLEESRFSQTSLKYYLKASRYKNFSELINRFRVEDFKEKLNRKRHPNFDLLSIAKESGFKSKANFYRIFKKYEGITPREYQTSLIDN